jgi:hypothetical protein
MASIVEWQSLKMQEYRYELLVIISRIYAALGVIRPVRYDPPVPAGEYDTALHVDHPGAPSFLEAYLDPAPVPVAAKGRARRNLPRKTPAKTTKPKPRV